MNAADKSSAMNHDLASPERDDIRAKEVTLDLYEDLLQTIWGKTCRTLGPPTMQVLLRLAITQTSAQYGWLELLRVDKQAGLVLDDLRKQLEQIDEISLKRGFQAIISALMDTMTNLTGGVVTKLLIGIIDERLSAENATNEEDEPFVGGEQEIAGANNGQAE